MLSWRFACLKDEKRNHQRLETYLAIENENKKLLENERIYSALKQGKQKRVNDYTPLVYKQREAPISTIENQENIERHDQQSKYRLDSLTSFECNRAP